MPEGSKFPCQKDSSNIYSELQKIVGATSSKAARGGPLYMSLPGTVSEGEGSHHVAVPLRIFLSLRKGETKA